MYYLCTYLHARNQKTVTVIDHVRAHQNKQVQCWCAHNRLLSFSPLLPLAAALNPTRKSIRHAAWSLPRAISAKQASIWETAQAGKMATRTLVLSSFPNVF
jgi:hypothetical protein